MLKNLILSFIAALVLVGTAIAEPIQWTVEEGGNGHWYELVHPSSSGNWCEFQNMANEQTYLGIPGYLVTITSEAEQDWIFTQYGCELNNWILLGAYQWSMPGQEPGGNWFWITGEPWEYRNWDYGEPNNLPSGYDGYGEDLGMFSIWDCDGDWNDIFSINSFNGYIVEFGEYNPVTLECWGSTIPSEQSTWGEIKKAYR